MALKLPVLTALHICDRMQQYLLELDSSHSICVTLSNSALFSPILSYSVGSVDSIKSMRILWKLCISMNKKQVLLMGIQYGIGSLEATSQISGWWPLATLKGFTLLAASAKN